MPQLLHDCLDDVLLYTVIKRDFSIHRFNRANVGGFSKGRSRGSYRIIVGFIFGMKGNRRNC